MYIINGPYLQDPRKNSMQFFWETDEVSTSEVHIYEACRSHVIWDQRPVGEEPIIFRGESGTLHRVKAERLTAGTDYYYKVYSENEKGVVSGGMKHTYLSLCGKS